jgi:hypothetical protein
MDSTLTLIKLIDHLDMIPNPNNGPFSVHFRFLPSSPLLLPRSSPD